MQLFTLHSLPDAVYFTVVVSIFVAVSRAAYTEVGERDWKVASRLGMCFSHLLQVLVLCVKNARIEKVVFSYFEGGKR